MIATSDYKYLPAPQAHSKEAPNPYESTKNSKIK